MDISDLQEMLYNMLLHIPKESVTFAVNYSLKPKRK